MKEPNRMESEDVPVAVSIWKPNELPESLGSAGKNGR